MLMAALAPRCQSKMQYKEVEVAARAPKALSPGFMRRRWRAGHGLLFNQSRTWHAVIKVVSQSNVLVRNRTDELPKRRFDYASLCLSIIAQGKPLPRLCYRHAAGTTSLRRMTQSSLPKKMPAKHGP